jgi:hypothetical protein
LPRPTRPARFFCDPAHAFPAGSLLLPEPTRPHVQ